jgi:ABC-type dipeptide/oligopeptide/nickel transport system permease component
MPPLVRFAVRRLALLPVTLLIVTAVMYGLVMFTPAEARAELYLPNSQGLGRMSEEQLRAQLQRIIRNYGLNDPYPVQYVNWLRVLIEGEWGWSPIMRAPVLQLITTRMPVTIELLVFTLLFYAPLGIVSGVVASHHRNRRADRIFRVSAFTATSIPPFVLGLMMLSFLYVGLGWVGPGRLSASIEAAVRSPEFKLYTGMYTVDGLLNGRLDVALDALQHLIMPVVAVSAVYWATVGRVTRAVMIEELDKQYVIAAEARGISDRLIYWRHALRNALIPALTTSALSAASLLTGVYVIERVFNLHGVSEVIVSAGVAGLADAPAALGFAVYSVILVLVLMFILDIIQALVDPRLRERLTE